jgi:hypothetical protein
MEHLWSQAGATGGNPSQTRPPKKRLRNPDRQPVATPRNNETFDGKEGVDGSSPSEGFRLVPAERLFLLPESAAECFVDVHPASTAWTLRLLQGVVGVEQRDCVLASVAREVAVVAVDHRQAGAHVAGEIEG